MENSTIGNVRNVGKSDAEIRRLAGHPDCVPEICIDWFVKGYKEAINEMIPKKYNFCTIAKFDFKDGEEIVWSRWMKWNKYFSLSNAEEGLKTLLSKTFTDERKWLFAIVPYFNGKNFNGTEDVYGNKLFNGTTKTLHP